MSNPALIRGDLIWHTFSDRDQLAAALAERVASTLVKACTARGSASIAFSGGSTPKPLFEALQSHEVPWQDVVTTLVDERWVDTQHELSNQQFFDQHLLSHLNPRPVFVPLYHPVASPRAAFDTIELDYDSALAKKKSQKRFDSVILGMGTDGHTASFFPDADNVAELVRYDSSVVLQACESSASQVMRITWSLAALLDTHDLVLHITGQDKRDLFERAIAAPSVSHDDLAQWPIRSMAYQRQAPLHIFYAD